MTRSDGATGNEGRDEDSPPRGPKFSVVALHELASLSGEPVQVVIPFGDLDALPESLGQAVRRVVDVWGLPFDFRVESKALKTLKVRSAGTRPPNRLGQG